MHIRRVVGKTATALILVALALVLLLILQKSLREADTRPPCLKPGTSDAAALPHDTLMQIQVAVYAELLRKYSAADNSYSGPNYYLDFEERDPDETVLARLSAGHPSVFPASLLDPGISTEVRDVEGREGVLLSISRITVESENRIVVCASVVRHALAAQGGEVVLKHGPDGWQVTDYDVQWLS